MIISIDFDLSYADSNKGNLVLVRGMKKSEQLDRLSRVFFTVYWVINMILLKPFPKWFFEEIYETEDFIHSNEFGTVPEGNNLPRLIFSFLFYFIFL